jgi:putative membrane protein
MNRTRLIKKATGLVSVAALASVISFPGLAQVNPRPSIFEEPRYDGIPGGATPIAPSSTPSLEGTNPRPSIFNEPRYDGIPGTAPATAPLSSTSMTQISSLDREFMRMAAHSDQFEIQSSQLALQKSSNPEVRAYAQMMIQEHTQSSQQLSQIAAQMGYTLPTEPSEFQQAVIEQLAQLSGAEFDRAYMEAQANGHDQTAAIYRTEIGQGQAPALKTFAAQILPIVEEHYQVASSMVPSFAQDTRRPVQ